MTKWCDFPVQAAQKVVKPRLVKFRDFFFQQVPDRRVVASTGQGNGMGKGMGKAMGKEEGAAAS
jgi:hypothetical protein